MVSVSACDGGISKAAQSSLGSSRPSKVMCLHFWPMPPFSFSFLLLLMWQTSGHSYYAELPYFSASSYLLCPSLLIWRCFLLPLQSPGITQSSAALLHSLLINSGESLFAALDEIKGYHVSAALLQSATSNESSCLDQGQRGSTGLVTLRNAYFDGQVDKLELQEGSRGAQLS